MQARAERLSAALRKLPATESVTYRGGRAPATLPELYPPARMIFEPGFTSTSSNLRVATENLSGDLVTCIVGHSGRDLSPYSAHPAEAEIVYDRGSWFRVLACEKVDDNDLWIAVLAEAAPGDRDQDRPLTTTESSTAREQVTRTWNQYQRAVTVPAVSVTSPDKFTGLVGVDRWGVAFHPAAGAAE